MFLSLEIGAFCYKTRRTILQLGMFFGFTWARLLDALLVYHCPVPLCANCAPTEDNCVTSWRRFLCWQRVFCFLVELPFPWKRLTTDSAVRHCSPSQNFGSSIAALLTGDCALPLLSRIAKRTPIARTLQVLLGNQGGLGAMWKRSY